MPLRRLTPVRMSCFAIGFPLLGTTKYPQTPFIVAKVSPYWVQQNTLRPLLHLLEGLEDFQSSQRLNNNDRKEAIHRINKTVHQTVPKY
jgi:hypothetical protein